jgi:hypothetical protein
MALSAGDELVETIVKESSKDPDLFKAWSLAANAL